MLFRSDKFQQKVEEYSNHIKKLQIERGEKQLKRESEIDSYLKIHNGELHDLWDNEVDALFFKISINGNGLIDLVHTYQYLFEVKFDTTYNVEQTTSFINEEFELKVLAPEYNVAKVCIIDSGIQEDHILIKPAIDKVDYIERIE